MGQGGGELTVSRLGIAALWSPTSSRDHPELSIEISSINFFLSFKTVFFLNQFSRALGLHDQRGTGREKGGDEGQTERPATERTWENQRQKPTR